MSIALGAAFFGPQPPQQSPKQGFAPPDSSQLYSLFSAGVVAASSISISTYKDAVTVQVGTYKDAVTVQVAAIDKKIEAIDKEIKVIEKANDRRIDAIEKKTEAIDKKTEAIDKKTEKTEATLVLVVVAVVASVVAGFVLERQRAKDWQWKSAWEWKSAPVFFFSGSCFCIQLSYHISQPIKLFVILILPFHVQASSGKNRVQTVAKR